MRFGLALPHYDFGLPGGGPVDWPLLRDWAQRAEELGFDSVWVSDHLFLDLSVYGGPPDRQGALECFTTMAALTTVTTRVRIGSLVVCNDLRNPALVAKMAATLDVLSGGRVEIGMGAGWYEPEYAAAGIPFDRPAARVARLAEAVQIVVGMLSHPSFSFEGEHYRVEEAWNLPRPGAAPPEPDAAPLVPPGRPAVSVGGRGDRVVGVAARHADGYNTVWAWTPDRYRGRVELLERRAAEAGRDPASIRRSVGLYVLPSEDRGGLRARWQRYLAAIPGLGDGLDLDSWAADKLAGTPDEIAARIEEFRALGVDEIVLGFGLVPFQIADASAVELFAREVAPRAGAGQRRERGAAS